MPLAHRENDSRICGAVTIVVGQSTVRINGELWAVQMDPNSHGAGGLINSISSVRINGKPIIVKHDTAVTDSLLFPPHDTPKATGSCDSVNIGE